jgi:hypothetical protein
MHAAQRLWVAADQAQMPLDTGTAAERLATHEFNQVPMRDAALCDESRPASLEVPQVGRFLSIFIIAGLGKDAAQPASKHLLLPTQSIRLA